MTTNTATVATARLLMKHSIVKHGMGAGSPDTCLCGAELAPVRRVKNGFPEEISLSRRRAFAFHVATAETGSADTIDEDPNANKQRVLQAFNQMPYAGSLSMTWGPTRPERLTFGIVADRLEGVVALIRRVAADNERTAKELNALKAQREAVREFLGLNSDATQD